MKRTQELQDLTCLLYTSDAADDLLCVDLGDEVKSGQLIAKVHNIERTGSPPDEYHAKIDGIFTGKHFPGHVVNGDFLGVIAVPV